MKDKLKSIGVRDIVMILAILGGGLTIGDRLWADKGDVKAMQVKIDNMDEKVDYIHGIFKKYDKWNEKKNGVK